jgi:hypothetical protein
LAPNVDSGIPSIASQEVGDQFSNSFVKRILIQYSEQFSIQIQLHFKPQWLHNQEDDKNLQRIIFHIDKTLFSFG